MARRIPTFPSGGGIDLGAPAQVDAALFLEQVSPPVANTWRLARINDASQSIIAPGILAGNHSFVMGEHVIDAVGGDRSVLIGYNLAQNVSGAGLATDQVMIGNGIQIPAGGSNSQGFTAIGSAFTFTSFPAANSVGGTVAVGNGIKLVAQNASGGDASNAVAVGPGVTITGGGGVGIGALASASPTSVAIGQSSLTGLDAIAIGYQSDASFQQNISVGRRARGGQQTMIFGWFADGANATNSSAFGYQASVNGRTNAMAFGRESAPGTDGMVLFGSRNYPALFLQFGAGENNATGGVSYRFATTNVFGGAGNNLEGNTLTVQAGGGTGNWTNTQNRGLDLQVGAAQASGSTAQTPTSVIAMRHSDLNVSVWGGLGATMGGGVKVMFIGNATTAPSTAPTGGGLMYVTGGQLHFVSSAGVDYAITPTGGGGGGLPTTGGTMTGAILFNADNTIDIGANGATRARTLFLGTSLQVGNSPAASGVIRLPSGGTIVSRNGAGTGDITLLSGSAAGQLTLGGGGSVSDILLSSVSTVTVPGTVILQSSTSGGALLGNTGNEFSGLFIKAAVGLTLTSATTTVGAATGTLLNCPTAGNPTGYLRVNINGAVGKIPYWV